MSNLIRGRQDLLMNVVTGNEVGMYVDSAGVKHLVLKPFGIDIPATGSTAVIKSAQAGVKQKITLNIDWTWNGESEKIFEIEVAKQPLYSGFSYDHFRIIHTYQFKKVGFSTSTPGTLNTTDKDAIINGLIADITADVQLGPNQINTGACVVGTLTSHQLVLEAAAVGIFFTVRAWNDQFSQTLTTAFQKATLTNDDVYRLFSVKPENAGQWPVLPLHGVEYVEVSIVQNTVGYDNVVASGSISRSQIFNIYMPKTALSAVEFATVTNAGTNANSMADTVGTKAKDFVDYVTYLCGANVVNNTGLS